LAWQIKLSIFAVGSGFCPPARRSEKWKLSFSNVSKSWVRWVTWSQ
jgi:hypothetical protein